MGYIFDPEIVHRCSLAALGRPKPEMFDAFAAAMEEQYPGRLDHDQPWIFSNAGGAMIQMKLYYASINEYIMIWGTPIGSEGHSGRHAVGFWDTVIDGEMWYYGEGQFTKRVYTPGDRVYVGPGQARAMNFTTGVWATEYARGPLPLSIPFGLADELVSTLDFATAAQTLAQYASLVGRHWRLPPAGGGASSFLRSRIGGLLESAGRAVSWVARPPEPDDTIPRGDPGGGPHGGGPVDSGGPVNSSGPANSGPVNTGGPVNSGPAGGGPISAGNGRSPQSGVRRGRRAAGVAEPATPAT